MRVMRRLILLGVGRSREGIYLSHFVTLENSQVFVKIEILLGDFDESMIINVHA
jgi:hypothetical protein